LADPLATSRRAGISGHIGINGSNFLVGNTGIQESGSVKEKQMAKSISIIGAGIAGLAAGCYGQMNGYETQIFEMHDQPGGVCTAWQRKDYTIDACLHWLVGSNKKSNFYPIWEELGAVQNRQFVNFEEFRRVEDNDGKSFIIYADLDRLEKHMLELAPEDKAIIKSFIGGARNLTKFKWSVDKAPELENPIDKFKLMLGMCPCLGTFMKWRKVSTAELATWFKNPFLHRAFHEAFAGDMDDFSAFAMQMTLAWQHIKEAGYPIGGSLPFAQSIEKRYLQLGGKINYKKAVNKIIVENGQAVGIQLTDGTEHRSDIIISAADGHSTIFNMLEGKFLDEKIKGYYDKLPLFPPLVHVALGVNRDFSGSPHHISYILDKPMSIGNHLHKSIGFTIYNYDPTLAKPGKTLLISTFNSDYDYWNNLKQENPKQYDAEKEKIADQLVAFLDTRFPGLAKQVEMRDVATPLTWERYSGNWRGSYEGWLITIKTFMMRMGKELPGLSNFYMVGQWVEPGGGVPTAALSGRNVMQIICQRDKKKFITAKP
jgi:phytoene dehydrogenase-like protein